MQSIPKPPARRPLVAAGLVAPGLVARTFRSPDPPRDGAAETLPPTATSAVGPPSADAAGNADPVETRAPAFIRRVSAVWRDDGDYLREGMKPGDEERLVVWEIFPGERDAALRRSDFRPLREDRSVIGVELHAGPNPSSLEHTRSYDIRIEDGVLEELGRATHLQSLDLSGVDLTGEPGPAFLATLDKLRVLKLYHCGVGPADVLPHLTNCPDLRVLSVPSGLDRRPGAHRRYEEGRVIREADVAPLIDGSPRLREVFLASAVRFEPAAVRRFAELQPPAQVHFRNYDGVVPRGDPDPRREAAAERLGAAFVGRGFEPWTGSWQRWPGTFTLPASLIAVPPRAPPGGIE